MGQHDFCTQFTRRAIESVEVEHNGNTVPFADFVDSRGRQLKKGGQEFVTLSALRVLIATALHGRRGIQQSSAGAGGRVALGLHHRARLPSAASAAVSGFCSRSAVSQPAVLVGIGIAVHQATGWASDGRMLSEEELFRLLNSVHWEREARYWDGVAASANAASVLNFGGVKDTGGRVADALLHPETEFGRKIRGW